MLRSALKGMHPHALPQIARTLHVALSDPQSITIAGSAISLPRVAAGDGTSTYQSSDGLVRLIVSNTRTKGGRFRRTIRVQHRKIAADPFSSSTNAQYDMATYVVMDVPSVGYTVAQQKEVWDGLSTVLTATSGAFVTKVLGGEN
jgi:hypothetical protein